MTFLLPYRFKRVGVIITPLGFALWLCMQFGYVSNLFSGVLDENGLHTLNVFAAILGFFSFLAGLYFLSFAKEKIEDEMIQKLRLESFQFAALLQIIFIIAGFLWIFLYKEPDKEGLMLFFIAGLLIFWISFIGRFNFILKRLK